MHSALQCCECTSQSLSTQMHAREQRSATHKKGATLCHVPSARQAGDGGTRHCSKPLQQQPAKIPEQCQEGCCVGDPPELPHRCRLALLPGRHAWNRLINAIKSPCRAAEVAGRVVLPHHLRPCLRELVPEQLCRQTDSRCSDHQRSFSMPCNNATQLRMPIAL